jgi:hypothetical protein
VTFVGFRKGCDPVVCTRGIIIIIIWKILLRVAAYLWGGGLGAIGCSWLVRPDDAEYRVVDPIEALVIVYPRDWGLKLTFNDVTKCQRLGIAGTGL